MFVLLADWDGQEVVIVITAFSLFVSTVVTPIIFAFFKWRLDVQMVENGCKLDDIAMNIATVEKATNSLTDRLVESTRAEATLQGGQDERDRVASGVCKTNQEINIARRDHKGE